MENLLQPLVAAGVAGTGVVLGTLLGHRRWQDSVDRERFLLGMKAAATPERLRPGERARLRLLRTPWWAVWRWLPDRLGGEEERRAS